MAGRGRFALGWSSVSRRCSAARAKRPPSRPPGAPRPAALRTELEPAPEGGELAALVQQARERARQEGPELVVYVGAPWCEPCSEVSRRGEGLASSDAVLPALRLLEFDLDRDRERLAEAGYASEMIPLFVVPRRGRPGTPSPASRAR